MQGCKARLWLEPERHALRAQFCLMRCGSSFRRGDIGLNAAGIGWSWIVVGNHTVETLGVVSLLKATEQLIRARRFSYVLRSF